MSNDGGSGHSFFTFTGSVRDTSDVGPDASTTQFEFTGTQGGQSVDTGIFTPAATQGAANDNSAPDLNFLGNDDGPCNDCFGPKVIATISTVSPAGVPEPASLAILGAALGGLGLLRRRRSR